MVVPVKILSNLIDMADHNLLPSHWQTGLKSMEREIRGLSPDHPFLGKACSECGADLGKPPDEPVVEEIRVPSKFVADLIDAIPEDKKKGTSFTRAGFEQAMKGMRKVQDYIREEFTKHVTGSLTMRGYVRPGVYIDGNSPLDKVPEYRRGRKLLNLEKSLSGLWEHADILDVGDVVRVRLPTGSITGWFQNMGMVQSIEKFQMEFDVGMAIMGKRNVNVLVDLGYNKRLHLEIERWLKERETPVVVFNRADDWVMHGRPYTKQMQSDPKGLLKVEFVFLDYKMGPDEFPSNVCLPNVPAPSASINYQNFKPIQF